MKFALSLALLVIGASCILAQNVTTWGDVHSTKVAHQQRVVAPWQILRVQNRTVSYRAYGAFVVRGIMHIDYQQTHSTARISDGGLGYSRASVNILSRRNYGINSTVVFYV